MKRFLSALGLFIKYYKKPIWIILLCHFILLTVFFLYSLPLEPFVYSCILINVVLFVIGVLNFSVIYKKHKDLDHFKESILLTDIQFPETENFIEQDYQGLLRIVRDDRIRIINEKDATYTDMKDYYTLWAHQIKTPIAAMRLVLQSEKNETNSELLEQLFRIEQYVELVLQYLRMESMSSDLLFQRYSLDGCIKQAIRKYSKSFILKKIKLNYESLDKDVLTDEKWLVFVLEQLLSNALKYTQEGEISIYMDKDSSDTLVIEDTGIGIAPEDLPRVFEKGYTGYAGRADKKSTGIGLYLCNTILKKLSHTLKIESEPGEGTKVKIGFDTYDLKADD